MMYICTHIMRNVPMVNIPIMVFVRNVLRARIVKMVCKLRAVTVNGQIPVRPVRPAVLISRRDAGVPVQTKSARIRVPRARIQ